MKRNICLIGFMGSGKSTLGKALAEKIGWFWIDLDAEIAKGENMTIADIFAQKGEAYFRSLESKYLKQALKAEKTVISTGGGAVVTPENVEMLKAANTFYLEWNFESLYEHIAGDVSRPLVTNYEEVLSRYRSRQTLYQAASKKVIHCEHKTIDEVMAEILNDGNDSLNEKR